jgi:PAS domain S-box-containing protein
VPEGRQDRPDSGEAEKKTTLSSRESELRYRRLFETAQDGILIIDFDSERIIDANPFLTQLLGYPHDELVGKTLWEIGPFSDVVRSKIAFDELKTKDSIRYEDLPLETRDGRQCKVEFVSNVYALDGAKVIQCNIRDITERKQAEEAMRRQADLLQKTFDSMTAAVFILDARLPTPTVVECNQAACAVFGYGMEEMLGKTTEFLHVSDETLREFRALLYSAVEEGRLPFHLAEFHMKRKNGTIFPSEHTVSQLTNIKGERTAWVSIVREITEQKRAEEALRESEARYRTLFDSTNDAIFIHDMGRRFLEFNKVFCELLGYSREELLQMTPADVSSPEYASQVLPRLAELRQVGHAFFESAYVRRDGTIIPIELSTRIIEFKGKPTVLSIARDVTERKRMETALKESEERYRMMFRSMGDAVAVYEAMDQGNDFVFRDFNEAAERIEKIKSEDVIGRSILEVFPGVKDLGLFEVFQRVWKTGKPEHLPAGIYKDRRIVGWRENYVYKLPSGELVAVYQDVTDRKRLEEELRQYSLHLESLVNERTKELRSARERLEYVIGSNPAVIYTGKPLADGSDFVLTYISERVSAMLGFEPSDFIGHPEFWERHVHPEDLRPTLVQIPRLWKEGQHAFEYRFLHKDGTYRWIREEGKVGRDTDGKPIEVNGYWTDVSERKRLEEELVKSQRLVLLQDDYPTFSA